MLYIIATPIGNLDDITFRAIKVLKNVDIILAEDTRHSKKLLNHYLINTPIKALHQHNETQQTTRIISQLLNGKSMALISDAGTPLINDPGNFLVAAVQKAGIKISPIPGASALISALSVSAMGINGFSFYGFLPNKKAARLKFIEANLYRNEAVIFYESPKRILNSLIDWNAKLGSSRLVCLARELTKSFETIKTAPLPVLIDYLQADDKHQKGEFVVIISAIHKKEKTGNAQQLEQILPILLSEMGASKAAKIAAKITHINKKECYQQAIK